MGADFGDAALIEDDQPVGVPEGGQPVGDGKGGAVLGEPCQRFLNELFRFRIKGSGGFV